MTSRHISPARKVAAVAGVGLSMWFLTAPAFAAKPSDPGKPGIGEVGNGDLHTPATQQDGAGGQGHACDGNQGAGNGNPVFAGCGGDADPGNGNNAGGNGNGNNAGGNGNGNGNNAGGNGNGNNAGGNGDGNNAGGNDTGTNPPVDGINTNADVELGEGTFLEKTPEGLVSRNPADPAASAPPANPDVLGNQISREVTTGARPVATVGESGTADTTGAAPAGRDTEVAGVQVVRNVGSATAAPGLAATGADTTSGMLRLAGFVLSLGGALMALAQRKPRTTAATA